VKLGGDGRLCRMAEYFFVGSYNSIAWSSNSGRRYVCIFYTVRVLTYLYV
jgi:hypothetical protein